MHPNVVWIGVICKRFWMYTTIKCDAPRAQISTFNKCNTHFVDLSCFSLALLCPSRTLSLYLSFTQTHFVHNSHVSSHVITRFPISLVWHDFYFIFFGGFLLFLQFSPFCLSDGLLFRSVFGWFIRFRSFFRQQYYRIVPMDDTFCGCTRIHTHIHCCTLFIYFSTLYKI